MAKVTIPYKSLSLKMRLCFKPYKTADGTHELCCRWWFAIYMGIKTAFNLRCMYQEEMEKSND